MPDPPPTTWTTTTPGGHQATTRPPPDGERRTAFKFNTVHKLTTMQYTSLRLFVSMIDCPTTWTIHRPIYGGDRAVTWLPPDGERRTANSEPRTAAVATQINLGQ